MPLDEPLEQRARTLLRGGRPGRIDLRRPELVRGLGRGLHRFARFGGTAFEALGLAIELVQGLRDQVRSPVSRPAGRGFGQSDEGVDAKVLKEKGFGVATVDEFHAAGSA
ncbi:hypothetical protein ACFCYX_33095 [Streptomyces populi]|uniref:hypothetical protein n=1 Tax=Streptomyces populi TaxID=2058924 RepID=UPI0013A6F5E8|nr:hypothetical protein [Streptomyces populi]